MIMGQVSVQSGCVSTEGDDLYYEVHGHSQPLLLISGGGGDAGFFSFIADILADEYKVITYDRRGNSRSTRNEPQNFEISQQSRDAVAVLKAVGEESAFVFGNSGGAVIALDMAKTQPQAVRMAVVHEAPILRVLPDSAKLLRFAGSLYQTGYQWGTAIGMLRFSFSLHIPMATLSKSPKDFSVRVDEHKNHDFFMKYEMLPFLNYLPDVDGIKRNGVKVVMAAGKMTLDKQLFYGRPTPLLADALGCKMVIFPGNHLSYFDQPREFAATLRSILHNA